MKIVIDARIINSSTGRYVERLIHYLQQIDKTNHYTILVRAKDKDYWQPSARNFRVKVADFDNYSLAEQIGFKSFLEDLRPDLVHFCMPQQPILYRGNCVTTFHDLTLLKTYNSDKNWLIYHIKQAIGGYVFQRVAHKNHHIICPSEFTKKDLVRFARINPDKVTVTYESAEPVKGSLKKYDLPFKDFIMYVGQQPDYKNIKKLGQAHQKLLKKHPNLGLVLVGRKKDDTLANEKYFNDKGFKNIHFTDFIEDDQRDWLYKNCIGYVFPSLMEGFGLPGLEAMAAGAPVISSNETCLPEIYGRAAHYFDPRNVDDISRAIEDVISDPELRKELKDFGDQQIKKYSWKKMAEQTHEVYLEALKHSHIWQ